jgi:hypothetical protein
MIRLGSTLLLLVLFAPPAAAQTQAGAHYSGLALDYPDQARHGFGGFFTYAPRPWVGVDVTTAVFPSDDVGNLAWQLLAGPRAGITLGRIGIFGHVRPGFLRFSERFFAPEIACILIFPPPESCLVPKTNFALGVGGTMEAALPGSTVLRVELGDAMTRYTRDGEEPTSWKHAVNFTVGAGWRF